MNIGTLFLYCREPRRAHFFFPLQRALERFQSFTGANPPKSLRYLFFFPLRCSEAYAAALFLTKEANHVFFDATCYGLQGKLLVPCTNIPLPFFFFHTNLSLPLYVFCLQTCLAPFLSPRYHPRMFTDLFFEAYIDTVRSLLPLDESSSPRDAPGRAP